MSSPRASPGSTLPPPDIRECDVDLAFTGALQAHDQGPRIVPVGDPRYPGQWALGTRGHLVAARYGSEDRQLQLIIRIRDHDASGPARPVVTLAIERIPPEPTAATSPSTIPSGIELTPNTPLTFLEYHWVVDIPPDEAPPPGFSLPPAVGTAAFAGPAAVEMDLVFNVPPADPTAPAGDIAVAGSIVCPEATDG